MECLVCFEEKHNFIWFECAHSVCTDCFAQMVQFKHKECPACRCKIRPAERIKREPEPDVPVPEPMCSTMSSDTVTSTCVVLGCSASLMACIIYTMIPP